MTAVVSGLGSSSSLFPAVNPHQPRQVSDRGPHERPETALDQLTEPDRALIFRATGQWIGRDFDTSRETPNRFATAIAADRSSGLLAPNQEVTTFYLKDLAHRFDRRSGPNPIAPYLDRAVDYLTSTGRSRVDVTA